MMAISLNDTNAKRKKKEKREKIPLRPWDSLLDLILERRDKRFDNQSKDKCLRPWESFTNIRPKRPCKSSNRKEFCKDSDLALEKKIKEQANKFFGQEEWDI